MNRLAIRFGDHVADVAARAHAFEPGIRRRRIRLNPQDDDAVNASLRGNGFGCRRDAYPRCRHMTRADQLRRNATTSTGIAIPTPADAPEPDMIMLVTPIKRPALSSKGPPGRCR
jgi:hypothetical protein